MAHGPGAVRALNATTTGDLTFEDPETDIARFDCFPAELRFRIAVSNTKIAARALENHVAWCRARGIGVERSIAQVNKLEANDIEVFAGQYRGRYKTELPHVAAGATIQRYGPLGLSKHPSRPFGRPVYHKVTRHRRRSRR